MIVFQVLTKHWGELNVHLSVHWSKFLLHKLKFIKLKNLKMLFKKETVFIAVFQTAFIFDVMFKTQLEQQAEVTDFVTKFHILMSFLWSLRVYYTQYEINTVVHLRQMFMENLGAQETGKKETNMSLLLPGTLFSFPPTRSLHSWFWIIIGRIRKQRKHRINLVWDHFNPLSPNIHIQTDLYTFP